MKKLFVAHQNTLWLAVSLFLVIVSILFRIGLFNEALLEPHRWRQGDTYFYVYDYWKNGVDFLRPAVCWMADFKQKAFEFPLPEAIGAWWWKLVGKSMQNLQLLFLLYFLGSAAYLYLLTRKLFDPRIALLAVVFYFFSPLGLYYGQGIIVDFFVLAASLGATWHFLIALDGKKMLLHFFVSAVCAAVALMVKAPCLLPFLPLLAWQLVKSPRLKLTIRYSWLAILPVAGFVWWSKVAHGVNVSAPDWNFIPFYGDFTDRTRWYFGYLEQRLDTEYYDRIWRYFSQEVMSSLAVFGVVLALILNSIYTKSKVLLWWLAGCVLHLLTFFNLIYIHNYYSIPYIPFAAVCLAWLLYFLLSNYRWLIHLVAVMYAIDACAVARERYFQAADGVFVTARFISSKSAPDEVVACIQPGITWCNPSILAQAERYGIQLDANVINDSTLALTHSRIGVKHFFYIHNLPDTTGNFDWLKPHYKGHWRFAGDWMVTEYQVP